MDSQDFWRKVFIHLVALPDAIAQAFGQLNYVCHCATASRHDIDWNLTLTKENEDKGFLAEPSARSGRPFSVNPPPVWPCCCSEKMCTVPLSLDIASQSGFSPLEKAMLNIHAGSVPRRSSCRLAPVKRFWSPKGSLDLPFPSTQVSNVLCCYMY